MVPRTKISLTRFSEFFTKRFEFVEINCLDSIEGWILLCSYIDSIAGYCFGGKSSSERFRRLLVKLDVTPRLDTISIPSIRYQMAQSLSANEQFLDFFRRQFAICTSPHWANDYNNQNRDTSGAKLKEELVESGLPIEKELTKYIKRYEYSNILWTDYRNCAIHESLIQTGNHLFHDIAIPYYATPEMSLSSKKRDFYFRIPPVYLLKIAEACITFVESRLRCGQSLEQIE